MKNPPLNVCVYCLRRVGEIHWVEAEGRARVLTPEDFGREHIFPQGLGGTDTLPKGSCLQCGEVTGEFERVCIRGMLWVARGLGGHKSGLVLPDENFFGGMPEYPKPHIMKGRPGVRHAHGTVVRFTLTAGDYAMLQKMEHTSAPADFVLDEWAFSRFLAKIVHGLCVRKYGVGGFVPMLPDLILDRRRNYWDLIGGADQRILRKGSCEVDHWIKWIPGYDGFGKATPRFVGANVRLFGNVGGMPTYQVFAGVLPGADPRALRELRFHGFIA